jgi:polysaccharide biosynthesis transport protein
MRVMREQADTRDRVMSDQERLPAPIEPAAGHVARQDHGMRYAAVPPAAGGSGGLSPKRLLRAVLRYKWVVLALALIGTVAAAFATRYVDLSYVAEATVWIEVPTRDDGMRGPIQASGLLNNEAWLELLRAYVVLDPVAREQRLYLSYKRRDRDIIGSIDVDPEVVPPGTYVLHIGEAGGMELRNADGTVVQHAAPGTPLVTPGISGTVPPQAGRSSRTVEFRVSTPRDAARQLDRNLEARLARGGNFVRLRYSSNDPERAAQVVNALADRYVAVAEEMKRARLTELRDILGTQLTYAEASLNDAEMSLEQFRVETITLPSEHAAPVAAGLESTQGTVLGGFFGLKVERETLQRDRAAIQRIVNARGQDVSVDALSAVPSVRQSPELSMALNELASKRADLRALHQQFTPEAGPVRRATEELQQLEREAVPALARRLAAELGDQMGQIDGMIGSASRELREIPARAIDEARYRRAVATAENLYNDLRQRFEAARLAEETAIRDVRVLDAATVPRTPALDSRIRLVLMGFAGSLAFGLLLAVGLDRADPRLRYAEQVTDGMGLNVIGAVPSLVAPRRMLGRGSKALRPAAAGPQVIESLRSIRMNLMYAHGAAGPLMATVTSPDPGDGKTFITSNLALSYADLGMRTLVIDGDTRRGNLHRVFGVERSPGLTEYLRGSAELHDVVHNTANPLVHVVSPGARLRNSPELLSSKRLGALLAGIRNDYDVILIDSPPLGAGVDPLVLGTLTGNIVLVMRTGNTALAVAEAKLRMLDNLPVRILGTVLNAFDADDSYRYYSYTPGYESGADEPAELELLKTS